jgi:hypothetical protein
MAPPRLHALAAYIGLETFFLARLLERLLVDYDCPPHQQLNDFMVTGIFPLLNDFLRVILALIHCKKLLQFSLLHLFQVNVTSKTRRTTQNLY